MLMPWVVAERPEELLGDGTLAAVGGAELPCLQHLAPWLAGFPDGFYDPWY